MSRRIWIALFAAFIVYSLTVYFRCDDTGAKSNDKAMAGMHTWQGKNCQSCHQLYGLGGYMGPDLTNIVSEPGKGPAYMRSFIKHGTGRMPDFNLTDTEVDNIIAFLSWVDRSGRSKVPSSAVHWTGTYNLPN